MIRILFALCMAVFLWYGTEVFAQGYSLDSASTELGIEKPKHLVGVNETAKGDASDATRFFQKITKGLIGVLATVAVFFVVYNALNMVMSAGDSDKLTNAKKAMKWIALGLLLVIFAYVIVKTVISLPFSGS